MYSCLPVVVAALIRPLLNTAFSLWLRSNLCAPPVTEMSSLGIGSFQWMVNKSHSVSRSVPGHSRTYCKQRKPILLK